VRNRPWAATRQAVLSGLCALGMAQVAAQTAAAASATPGLPAVAASSITLHDDAGRRLHLAAPPQRIVSLLPSLTESLHALGAGARLVGVDRYANWPPEVKRLPRLGGLDDALLEPILALKPDVVLASSSARALDRLEALGVPVLRLRSDSHADVQRSLLLLAQLLGQPALGPQAWQQIDQALNAAAARVPPPWRGRSVYFEIGGGPYAAGAASFIGETLARLGLHNIAPPSMGPFPKLNPEFVLRAQPALVVAAARDLPGMAQRPGWQSLRALQQQRWCALSPEQYEALVRPGPRLGSAAAVLADCLQALALVPRP